MALITARSEVNGESLSMVLGRGGWLGWKEWAELDSGIKGQNTVKFYKRRKTSLKWEEQVPTWGKCLLSDSARGLHFPKWIVQSVKESKTKVSIIMKFSETVSTIETNSLAQATQLKARKPKYFIQSKAIVQYPKELQPWIEQWMNKKTNLM